MAEINEIRELARELNLMNVANGTIDVTKENISNLKYLYNILSEEIRIRHEHRNTRLKKSSKLPNKKFDHYKITKGLEWQLQKISQFDFSNNHQNIIIIGDCSTGKTSLAVEIGNYAISKVAKVTYTKFDDLIFAIKAKTKLYAQVESSDVVIIDELFYTPITEEELLLIYKKFIFLSETRSLILITNRPLSKWSEMKVDQHLLETLKQRLLREAQLISLK